MLPSLKKKSILVICTGGTISMQRTEKGYATKPGSLAAAMEKIPEFRNPDMPSYTLHEYEHLIDSANMNPKNWLQMGKHIADNYDKYDGFVILHGTDTMAYSASALSFMLENLGKPVILTGSQLPLYETRSDARENLINAILMAGHSNIPEVCIYFNNKLLRGNRSKKLDANSFSAFGSPNFPALAKVGTEVVIRHHLARMPVEDKFYLQELTSPVISFLRVFPGMCYEMLSHLLKSPLQALVLESYGFGTAPEDEAFLQIIRNAVNQGIVVVTCSQCPTAKVKMSEYVAGSKLIEAGVISGGDMTAEATLAKLFYLFSQDLEIAEIKSLLTENLRGELTV